MRFAPHHDYRESHPHLVGFLEDVLLAPVRLLCVNILGNKELKGGAANSPVKIMNTCKVPIIENAHTCKLAKYKKSHNALSASRALDLLDTCYPHRTVPTATNVISAYL
jgi:hypothetical protein